MEPRISVVINTLNEEANLPFLLRSVAGWADEIVVVDMHSDDRTREIAESFGARVHLYERTRIVDAARGFALTRATGDWIFLLDADEVVPAPLRERLRQVAASDAADVVRIPWVNYIWGAPLSYTCWGPNQDQHPRFFKRGYVTSPDTIHAYLQLVPDARVLRLLPYRPGLGVVHFNYLDAEHFIEKLNRYTTVEALQARERGEASSHARTLLLAGKEFLRRYVRHRGYRDGWRGLYLSLFMSFYRLAAGAKLKELEEVGSREAVRQAYRQLAEEIIDGHRGASREEPIVQDREVEYG